MSQPRKPAKKQRPKKINLNSRTQWERILKSVDKKEVPVEVLEKVVVNLIDGTPVVINIRELLDEGVSPDELEEQLSEKLTELDHIIEDCDFYIDINALSETVQAQTDKLLKDL